MADPDAVAREPMLATLAGEPFTDPGWIFERKLDGERCLAQRRGGRVDLRSRSHEPLNGTYPELVEALISQAGVDLVVDGEVVAFDGSRTSFGRLQQRLGIHDPAAARRSDVRVFYYLFDLLWVDGEDVRSRPLRARKTLLRCALTFADPLRFVPHRSADGEAAFAEACRLGWEGLIAKAADSAYAPGRSRQWLKLKCAREQEFVIGGYTDPAGTRAGFGALLVGYYDGGGLRYAGKVGSGYSRDVLRQLGARLRRLERPDSRFDAGDPPARAVHWVEPELVAQIGYTELTRDGRLRHPRFIGLRPDKPASAVVLERPG
jgi:bifunctional non-homologous end joining protein LigD